ncbi:hypothetical protein PIB30_078179 [Stylosanthes scabra]|uniref:Uncharacterized protein n=1 Tax=Stylosanthes scabra TaxID=79078 RepID=A0ABU6WP34_9FABA|nr:hypothetical protein [Stylosanthes scabra]
MRSDKLLATSELLQTRAPDVNTEGLKAFFRQRGDKEVSTSNVVKDEPGSEVNKLIWIRSVPGWYPREKVIWGGGGGYFGEYG